MDNMNYATNEQVDELAAKCHGIIDKAHVFDGPSNMDWSGLTDEEKEAFRKCVVLVLRSVGVTA